MKARSIRDNSDVQPQKSEPIKKCVNLIDYPQGFHTALLDSNPTIDSLQVGDSVPVCVLRADGNLHGNITKGAGKFIPLDFNHWAMLNLHIVSAGGGVLPGEVVMTEPGVGYAMGIIGAYQQVHLDASES